MGSIGCDEPMARHTSYRIGGPADLFVECACLADLALALDVLNEERVEWTVIGKGSNVLVCDQGYRGAVIVLAGEFSECRFGELEAAGGSGDEGDTLPMGQEVQITAGAGVPLARLVQDAYGHGLSGLEALAGIPGSLGGAIFMNAGSRTDWIGSHLSGITIFRHGAGLRKVPADDVAWGYRASGLAPDDVIVEADIILKAADKPVIAQTMQELLDARVASQPLAAHCCGSVFKNPTGQSSGKLIHDCGLAGATCGDAHISTQHANFVINDGSARANDVLALMRLARDRVKETYGIHLAPEVRFLGFPLD